MIIAIVGILDTIAILYYREDTVEARLAEFANLIASVKNAASGILLDQKLDQKEVLNGFK